MSVSAEERAWKPDALLILRAEAAARKSASEIEAILADAGFKHSRDAVIGKAWRMKIPLGHRPAERVRIKNQGPGWTKHVRRWGVPPIPWIGA